MYASASVEMVWHQYKRPSDVNANDFHELFKQTSYKQLNTNLTCGIRRIKTIACTKILCY